MRKDYLYLSLRALSGVILRGLSWFPSPAERERGAGVRAIPALFLLGFLFVILIAACGVKAPPSLRELTPPPAPQDLSAIQRADTVILGWEYPEKKRTKEFVVEEKVNEGPFERVSVQSGEQFSTLVTYGLTYTFRVRARSVNDVLGSGAEVTIAVITPPAPPEALAVSIGPESLRLSWQYEEGFTFNVFKENGELEQVTKEPLVEMWIELPVEPDVKVTYEVRAVKGGPFMYEGEGARITVSPADFVPQKLAAPALVQTDSGVRLLWERNPEAWVRAYGIYKEAGGEFRKIGESSIPAYFDPGATGGTYRITARGPVSEGPLSGPASLPPR